MDDPYILLGVRVGESWENIKKAYRNLIRVAHTDRGGNTEIAARINVAYATLELIYEQSDGVQEQEKKIVELSDKSESEKYRNKFSSAKEHAGHFTFVDNFDKFYRSVFEGLEPPKLYEKKQLYHCETCETDFLNEDHHFDTVFGEYINSFQCEKGFFQYLRELVGDVLDFEPISWEFKKGSVWTDDRFWINFHDVCGFMEALASALKTNAEFKSADELLSWIRMQMSQSKIYFDDDGLRLLTLLLSSSTQEHWKYIQAFYAQEELNLNSLIYPAFLKVFHSFGTWPEQSYKFFQNEDFVIGLVFAKIHALLNGCSNTFWYFLGNLALPKNINVAHLCFQLGNLDSTYGSEFMKSGTVELGIQYLYKAKDIPNLIKFGMEARDKKGRQFAFKYFIPALRLALEGCTADNMKDTVNILTQMLPQQKWLTAVKALVTEAPEFLHCEELNMSLFEIFKEQIESILQLSVKTNEEKEILSSLISTTLPAMLHIAQEAKEGSSLAIEINTFLNVIAPRAIAGLLFEGMPLAKVVQNRKSTKWIRTALAQWNIIMNNKIKSIDSILKEIPAVLASQLLMLLGALHYHEGRQFQMVCCYEQALLHSPLSKPLKEGVAFLLTVNPLLQEQLVGTAWKQMQSLIEIKDLKDLNMQEFTFLFKNLHPKTISGRWTNFTRNYMKQNSDLESGLLRLYRGTDSKPAPEESLNESELSERAYCYLDIAHLFKDAGGTIGCIVMALSGFYRAMELSPELESKYAYRSIIIELTETLCAYNSRVATLPLATFSLMVGLTFRTAADLQFSKDISALSKAQLPQPNKTPMNFLDDNDVPSITGVWQLYLNEKTLWPLIGSDVCIASDTSFYFKIMNSFMKFQLQGNVRRKLHTKNIPVCISMLHLFNAVHRKWIILNDESDEQNLDDTKTEKLHTETQEFASFRTAAMNELAKERGYECAEIGSMMNWPRLRRNQAGFLDIGNRTLNFDGEVAYSQFQGMTVTTTDIQFHLLPAVPGDPKRPALFTAQDLVEIISNRYTHAVLSFDEVDDVLPSKQILPLPSNPYFKVNFQPKELCGSEVLMTAYHLDLIAKMVTTGQESSTIFPFAFRSVLEKDGLLENASDRLKDVLSPLPHLKKARDLRPHENVHRFFFQADEVERIFKEDWSSASFPVLTFDFGKVLHFGLKTQQMVRDKETGKLVDAPNQDLHSPEQIYVKRFNDNLSGIEELFPLISRWREIVKIFAAAKSLNWLESIKDVQMQTVVTMLKQNKCSVGQPYSNCGGCCSDSCKWSYWVPAVYREATVTDQQKVDHLMDILFFERNIAKSTKGLETVARKFVTFEEDPQNQMPSQFAREQDKPDMPLPTEEDAKKDPRFEKWPLLENYLIYGGVCGIGNNVDVSTLEAISIGTKVFFKDLTLAARDVVNDISSNFRKGWEYVRGTFVETVEKCGVYIESLDLGKKIAWKYGKDKFKNALDKRFGIKGFAPTWAVGFTANIADHYITTRTAPDPEELQKMTYLTTASVYGGIAGRIVGTAACSTVPVIIPVCQYVGSMVGGSATAWYAEKVYEDALNKKVATPVKPATGVYGAD